MSIGNRLLFSWEGAGLRAPTEQEIVDAMADILRNGWEADPMKLAPRCGVSVGDMLSLIGDAHAQIRREREAASPSPPLPLTADDRLQLNREVSRMRGLLEEFRAQGKVLYSTESALLSVCQEYQRAR